MDGFIVVCLRNLTYGNEEFCRFEYKILIPSNLLPSIAILFVSWKGCPYGPAQTFAKLMSTFGSTQFSGSSVSVDSYELLKANNLAHGIKHRCIA